MDAIYVAKQKYSIFGKLSPNYNFFFPPPSFNSKLVIVCTFDRIVGLFSRIFCWFLGRNAHSFFFFFWRTHSRWTDVLGPPLYITIIMCGVHCLLLVETLCCTASFIATLEQRQQNRKPKTTTKQQKTWHTKMFESKTKSRSFSVGKHSHAHRHKKKKIEAQHTTRKLHIYNEHQPDKIMVHHFDET